MAYRPLYLDYLSTLPGLPGGNPDHITLGQGFQVGLGLRVTFHVTPDRTVLRLGGGRVILHNSGCVLPGGCLIVLTGEFWLLAQVCTLLSTLGALVAVW